MNHTPAESKVTEFLLNPQGGVPVRQGLRPSAYVLWGKRGPLYFSHESTQFATPQVDGGGRSGTRTDGNKYSKGEGYITAETQAIEACGKGAAKGKEGALLS